MSNINKVCLLCSLLFLLIACQPNPYRQGGVIYKYNCERCHMEDGSGLEKLIPALKDSRLIAFAPDSLVCLIRKGVPLNPKTDQEMPPNDRLNEVELANLVNFLQTEYATSSKAIKVEDIQTWLAGCQSVEN